MKFTMVFFLIKNPSLTSSFRWFFVVHHSIDPKHKAHLLKRADVPLLESSFKVFQVKFYQNFLDTLTGTTFFKRILNLNKQKLFLHGKISWGKKVVLLFSVSFQGLFLIRSLGRFRNLPWNQEIHYGIPSLRLTVRPWKIGYPKRKRSYSNHPFSGAFAVSFREGKNPSPKHGTPRTWSLESATKPSKNWTCSSSLVVVGFSIFLQKKSEPKKCNLPNSLSQWTLKKKFELYFPY